MANPQDPRKTNSPGTVNEQLQDRIIRHLLWLTRLSTQEANQLLEQLNRELIPELTGITAAGVNRLKEMAGEASLITRQQARELQTLSNSLNTATVAFMSRVRTSLFDRLVEIARNEVDFELNLFRKTIPIEWNFSQPSEDQLRNIINTQPIPFNKGGKALTIREWFDNLSDTTVELINGQIRQGLMEGESIDQIMRRIRGTRAQNYSNGVLQTTRNIAEGIARTGVIYSSNQATNAFYRENSDLIKGIKIVVTLDSRTCETCMWYDANNPYELENHPTPPFHVNCLPGNTLVTPRGDVTGVSKRWYDGDVIVFRTTSGNELTCTPNHPILTDRGFVPADSIDVGNNVISDSSSQGVGLSDGNNIDEPTPIEDIAESFINSSEVVTRPVPVSPIDFHGDGAGSEVAIIGANRFLDGGIDSPVRKHASKLNFVIRNMSVIFGGISFSGFSTFAKFFKRMFSARGGFMSRFNLGLPLFFRHLRPLKGLCLRLGSYMNTILNKMSSDHISTDAEFVSECIFRGPAFVKRDNLISGKINPNTSWFNTLLFKTPANYPGIYSEYISNFVCAFASLVKGDNLFYRKLVSLASPLNSVFFKPSQNSTIGDSESLPDISSGFSRLVERYDFIYGKVFNNTGLLDTPLFKQLRYFFSINTGHPGDLSERFTRFIETDDSILSRGTDTHNDPELAHQIMNGEKEPTFIDEVVSVKKEPYSGYVYNIETTERYYIANGIASHNCRCATVAVTKSWRELGIDLDEAPEGTRSSMSGQVPESLTYNQWLRRQPREVVEEALGANRARLFLDGDLSVTSFTDRRGRQLSLQQIRQRESDVYERVLG